MPDWTVTEPTAGSWATIEAEEGGAFLDTAFDNQAFAVDAVSPWQTVSETVGVWT